MKRVFRIVFLCALLCAFTGCKSIKHIEQVPVEVHDTMYQKEVQRDSIYIDHFREVTKMGDTVYVTDSHISVTYRTVTDTAYKYIEKPVEVKVSQIKEVEKSLTRWQKFQMKGFWWLSVGLIGYVLFRTRKVWLKWLKRS